MSSDRPRESLAPQFALLAMIAIWGASFAAIKTALDAKVPKFVLIAGRFWLALPCLLPFLPAAGRRASLAATWRPGVLTGLALLCGYGLQTFGMDETTTSVGGFMTGLIVLLVALGARVVFGERLRAPTLTGLALGCLGLGLLCLGATAGDDGTNTLRGIALQIGSSTSFAAHVLLISRLSPRGHELAFASWQLLVVAVGATLLALSGADAAAAATDAPAMAASSGGAAYWRQPQVWLCLLYLGVLATGLGIGVQSRVQPRIRASQVAVLFATQPAFAALAGLALHGDRLGPLEWLGGALIAGGVLVASRGRADAR